MTSHYSITARCKAISITGLYMTPVSGLARGNIDEREREKELVHFSAIVCGFPLPPRSGQYVPLSLLCVVFVLLSISINIISLTSPPRPLLCLVCSASLLLSAFAVPRWAIDHACSGILLSSHGVGFSVVHICKISCKTIQF